MWMKTWLYDKGRHVEELRSLSCYKFLEFSVTVICCLRNSFRHPASPDSNLRSGEGPVYPGITSEMCSGRPWGGGIVLGEVRGRPAVMIFEAILLVVLQVSGKPKNMVICGLAKTEMWGRCLRKSSFLGSWEASLIIQLSNACACHSEPSGYKSMASCTLVVPVNLGIVKVLTQIPQKC